MDSIYIIDDDRITVFGIRKMLGLVVDCKDISSYANGKLALDAIKAAHQKNKKVPDVIFLDINMPIMDGFETAKWIKETHPNILVMALSMQDDEQSLIKMIKNGAKGYMLKNTQPTALEKGLETLINKGQFFPDWASSKILTSISENTINVNLKNNLSDREIEFLKYTTSEMTYKEMAEKMFCSPRTIENYRDSLFEKLELKSRVGLAVYALKNGYSE